MYSKLSMGEAQKKLGLSFSEYGDCTISAGQMLEEVPDMIDSLGENEIEKLKNQVY